jgi:hypothetical protein
MSLSLMPPPTLATNCYIIGNGERADVVWSKGDFLSICQHFLNGNALNHFMTAWADEKTGRPSFVKNKTKRADKVAEWAFNSIRGTATKDVAIGFYPSNAEGKSRWGAFDFDAHDGDMERARRLAFSTFQILARHPQLFLVLAHSGGGFHLFVLSADFAPVSEWTALLKQACGFVGAKIESGICEIFPDEGMEHSRIGKGIRAPGTINPKNGNPGLILADTTAPLRSIIRENCPPIGKVLSPLQSKSAKLSLHNRTDYYSPRTEQELEASIGRYPITRYGMRHSQTVRLIGELVHKVGYAVARHLSERHFTSNATNIRTLLAEHLLEFDAAWKGLRDKITESFSTDEKAAYANLGTEHQRDGFLIIRAFASLALTKGESAFPIAQESLACRLGISRTAAADIIAKLVDLKVLDKSAPPVPHKSATLYRWLLPLTGLNR